MHAHKIRDMNLSSEVLTQLLEQRTQELNQLAGEEEDAHSLGDKKMIKRIQVRRKDLKVKLLARKSGSDALILIHCFLALPGHDLGSRNEIRGQSQFNRMN